MGKLFAFEDIDESVDGVDLEASQEVGEVADVQVDVDQEVAAIDEQASGVEEGIDAGDQMEQVEDLVSQAAEEGDGLDPVAAEALRLAVESICARVGANPKSFYALYATENFQSASSRKANTRFALEGVGEFLKDLWKRIKAALNNLWTKVRAFWDKHVSSLGRIKKALESMKSKVSESSGKLKDKAYLDEAPSALVEAFGHSGDVTVKTIKEVMEAHADLYDSAQTVSSVTTAFNAMAANAFGQMAGFTVISNAKNFNRKTGTLVGGTVIEYKFEAEADEGNVTLEIEREQVDRKDKGGVSLAEKNDVKGLVDAMLKLITDNIKAKEKQDKLQDSFNKLSLAIEKSINGAPEDKQKNLRNQMKIAYKINAKAPSVNNEALSMNIRLAKAVLGYASLCVKNYK